MPADPIVDVSIHNKERSMISAAANAVEGLNSKLPVYLPEPLEHGRQHHIHVFMKHCVV